MTRVAKPKPFATERDLCAAFIAAIGENWTAFNETASWDILLSRKRDGFQVGVQAKLRLNTDVINQALEDYGSWSADFPGPDCRAVLVPDCDAGGFGRIAQYIGFTIIRMRKSEPKRAGIISYRSLFDPDLPDDLPHLGGRDEWHEWCPAKRHKLPDYVPDVAAGSSSPLQLTDWKIRAIKIAIILEQRGHVTRADFKHLDIDHRRWLTGGLAWLRVSDGRYIRDRLMPDFKRIHPRNYAEIAADAAQWMPPAVLVPAKQESLFAAGRATHG